MAPGINGSATDVPLRAYRRIFRGRRLAADVSWTWAGDWMDAEELAALLRGGNGTAAGSKAPAVFVTEQEPAVPVFGPVVVILILVYLPLVLRQRVPEEGWGKSMEIQP